MFKQTLFYFLFLFAFTVWGQNKKVVRYYAGDSAKIKNVYYVLKASPSVLNGSFWQFFENEKVAIKGGYSLGVPKGLWRYYYENGSLRLEGNLENQQVGDWKYYYENGQLQKMGRLNGQREEGAWTYFYENGTLSKRGDYLQGKEQGKWTYFYEDSVRKAEAVYENGEGVYKEFFYEGNLKMEGPIINGKSEGVWSYYYKNGGVKAKGLEFDGKKNGHWTYYYLDGSKSSEGTYTNSKQQGEWVYYYPNGRIQTSGLVTKGNREGEWLLFRNDGTIKGNVAYENDEGAYKEFYENGQLKVSGTILEGKREGEWQYFYESGKLEGQCLFVKDKGYFKGFYPKGDLKSEGELYGNIKIGLWKLYDKDGKVVYLRTVYDENQKEGQYGQVVDSVIVENIVKVESTPSVKIFKYKQPKKYRQNIRWLKPKPNEARGLIIGFNPFATIASSLPISIEYIIQERQGIQMRYTMIRQPFYAKEKGIPEETIYKRGSALDLIGKVYFKQREYGMVYVAPSIRVSSVNYFVKAYDSIPSSGEIHVKGLHAQEQTYEFTAVVGNRMVRTFRQSSLSFELFAGVGVGYRDFRKDYNVKNTYFDSLYEDVSQKSVFIPIRLGFSIGYFFK